ncbi:MAG: T9SS type A sorting domain-containing protein [Bacteroidota bacterium]
MRRCLLLLTLLGLAGASGAVAQPLILENTSPLDRFEEPVTLGVPFAPGALRPGAEMAVAAPDGALVAAQTQPMALWGDGSVRWLKVSFLSEVGAGATAIYQLQPGVTAPAPRRALTVEESATAITVTTGPLRFTVSKTAFTLFDQVWLDENADQRYTDEERLLDPSRGGGLSVAQAGRVYRAEERPPDEVRVESAGPVEVVIKVSGRHYDGNDVLLKYETRLYAYAGQPFIKVRHTYANGTSVASLGDSGNATLGASVDQYRLTLPLEVQTSIQARVAGVNGVTLGPNEALTLRQEDRSLRSQPFRYTVTQGGAPLTTGQRADGLGQLIDTRRGLTVGVRYFWEKNPKGLSLTGDGTVAIDLLPSAEMLWPGMGTGDEVLLHFHGAAEADRAWQRAQAFGLAPLFARTTPQQYVESRAFYALQAGPSAFPAMDTYFDQVTANHLANREALDLYGNLHFGDVPRGQWEIPDELDLATWGNNYYDAGLTAARRLAQTGDLRYAEVLVPMIRHWMETAAWNTYEADDWMNGFSPAYGINHRGIGHFQHHYGEGVWAYYYLTGDERAREVGLRAAESIVNAQDYANQFVALREAYQRGSAVLEAWKNTRDPRYLDQARALVGRVLATQDAYGLVGNVGEGGVFGTQTFMMSLFADTVWKLQHELPTPDPALTDALVGMADFIDRYARKAPGVEDYWNFWAAPGNGPPAPQGLDNPDGTVYWTGRAFITGAYAYAYDLSGDERFRLLALNTLDNVWGGIDGQGMEFWGKPACMAAKNMLHAVALVAENTATAVDEPPPVLTPVMQHGSYPNPFQEATTLTYEVAHPAEVAVTIYDLLGRIVRRLPVQRAAPGVQHTVRVEASDLAAGVYTYRIDAHTAEGVRHATGRLVLIR